MSASNYPYDQDRAFESFPIVDYDEQQIQFGKTFSQNDLLPVSFPKLIKAY